MKKLISSVVALFIAISAFGSINIGGLEYDLNYYSLTASVAKQNGVSPDTVVIPSTVYYDSNTYDVVSIADSAFLDCNLVMASIPNSVNSIGKWAFGRCDNLVSVNMPATLNSLGKYAFFRCISLESLVIPQGVTVVPDELCDQCRSLQSVMIPDGVTLIGHDAFAYCESLSQVSLPSSVDSIAMWAFAECAFTLFVIPAGVRSIELRVFSGCPNLTSITIPEGVTSIGSLAFAECTSLQQISLPSTLTFIDDFVFSECTALTSIVIPDGVPTMREYVFNGCTALTTVSLPTSVSTIENYAFNNCTSLTSVLIPEGVTSLGLASFNHCENMTSLSLPSTLTTIGERVFAYCESLENIYCGAAVPPTCSSNAFTNYDATLNVPFSAVSAYLTANPWQNFTIVPLGFTVLVNANDSLMGTVTGSGTYDLNSTVNLTAMPKADYAFTGWSDGSLDNPRSLVVSSDSSVSAIFAPRVIDTAYVDVELHDTIYETVYDTIINMVHDTLYITLHDTITEFVYDTLFEQVHDTIYEQIYDTIYLEYNGGSAMVYSLEDMGVYYFMGRIINTQGVMVSIYSADGKFLKKSDEDINMSSYAPGIYIATDGNGGFLKINHVNP